MKIGIIGFGAIGFDVAYKLDKEPSSFNVIGVHSRTKDKIIEKSVSFNSPLKYLELDEICSECDLIIDCAPKEAFKNIVLKCLKYKTKLITVSGAGISENIELINKARENSTQIFLASGAIIGLDGLSAVSEGEVELVKMITRKPPNALIKSKFVLEKKIVLDNLNQPKLIFSDNAFEGAKAFPANVNVAAAVGLAGIGAKKTHLEIWADPNLTKNTHSVIVKSDSSNFKIEIENIQSKENPGTGKITALSVIACLRGILSSLKVGT